MAITNAGQEKVLRCGKKIDFGPSGGKIIHPHSARFFTGISYLEDILIT